MKNGRVAIKSDNGNVELNIYDGYKKVAKLSIQQLLNSHISTGMSYDCQYEVYDNEPVPSTEIKLVEIAAPRTPNLIRNADNIMKTIRAYEKNGWKADVIAAYCIDTDSDAMHYYMVPFIREKKS